MIAAGMGASLAFALMFAGSAMAQPQAKPAAKATTDIRFGMAKPKPRTPGTIRLATYNAANLFDDHDDPLLSGKQEDAEMTKDKAHCRALAEAIVKIDADIVALQEIESHDALMAFRDRYLKDAGYEYVVSVDAGDERGIEQSVLSRFPVKENKNWVKMPLGGTHPEKWGNKPNNYAGQPITFHRSPLCVTVEIPTSRADVTTTDPVKNDSMYSLTLLVVHQKSGGDGNYWRVKEAEKTVELVAEMTKADPDRNIVILGDFNATMSQPPMQKFIGAGFTSAFYPRVPGEEKTQLATRDDDENPGSERGRRGPDPLRVTHESGRIIDHILFNAAALKELKLESRFVFGMPARPEGADYRVTPAPAGYASDHYPVVVDIVPKDQ